MNETTLPAAAGHLPACQLERILGKPAPEWTVEDLVGLVKDRGIRMVTLLHIGGDGTLKVLDFVPRSEAHLRDVLLGGERADGSSLFPGYGIRPGASDVVLRPRLTSAFLDPFSPLPTLALMSGHVGRTGQPLPESPDTIVHRAYHRLLDEAGVDLWALGEVEYFLGRRLGETEIHGEDERGYHSTSPFVFGEALRRQAHAILADIGVPVKYGHSEVGYIEPTEIDATTWEQHEIELELAPLPRAADCVALTRWVLSNLAQRHGMQVSFDPIMRKGHAGSGMHVHFSPVVDRRHAGGRTASGELSEPSRWLIAGLVQLGGALMIFGNRTSGSFIRITQGKEAPNTVVWGEFDRLALVRLPVLPMTEDGRAVAPPTIEFRLGDGSAHPHLLMAGVAQSMLHGRATPGLDELIARTEARRARTQPASASASVPRRFDEVAAALREHRAVLEAGGVFPTGLIDCLIETFGRP
ncbi:MAG: hypothetical protein KBD01_19640 [Acidobacteria bacterium]|nr:hypothetical protein [Acidobacteriota bacterium]